jgi:hypothetical protein
MTVQLADLSGSDLLDRADLLHERRRRTEVELLQVVAEFARQHGAGTVDPVSARLPGRERAVRLGGEGTPLVAEFAPAVLAARLQLSPYGGKQLVADVLDLEHRLPEVQARVDAGEAQVGHARYVARRTRELSREEAALVDRRVAESCDGRLSWSRFEALVDAAIAAADPETAAARERLAARETFAKPTRSTEHGMRGFYVRADFATIARIDATVAYLARALLALGDTSSLDDRRVKAVLIMANPAQAVQILRAYGQLRDRMLSADESSDEAATDAPPPGEPEPFDPVTATAAAPELPVDVADLLPVVHLFVHLAGGPVARVEGCSPVTAEWVRHRLGQKCRFRITPVLDPLAQVPVDAYEIPVRHRQAVHLLTPADTFPFASNTTRDMQIDHTRAYDRDGPPGQSRVGNYGPMTTCHHRIKTHGRWQVRQPYPGLYVWRDPHGVTYVVDHSGTRRVPSQRKSASRLELHVSVLVLAS